VTTRRSSYRSLASLQRDLSRCRACVEAGFPLESWPVHAPGSGQRAYIYGQAPGPVEGVERLPWRGSAGRKLREWLGLGEEEFYASFYCASVTRCDPGRSPTGRGDRTPEPREQELCAFWRNWELELLRPELIVTVGLLALKRQLGFTTLTPHIGERYEQDGVVVIPLPHPSGASSWPNVPANRERLDRALALVRSELRRIYSQRS
jgi:uracil-DNA glycosylase